jgi:REP element-mobilizing transposase RayT
MSKTIHKSHNVSVLIYHIVCPAKYRRIVFSDDVDLALKKVCLEISDRYEIVFLEIGTEEDHVHFLVQSLTMYSPKKIVQTIKSITARETFKRRPEVKEKLRGGDFWSDGYYVNSVGQHGNEKVIQAYVK